MLSEIDLSKEILIESDIPIYKCNEIDKIINDSLDCNKSKYFNLNKLKHLNFLSQYELITNIENSNSNLNSLQELKTETDKLKITPITMDKLFDIDDDNTILFIESHTTALKLLSLKHIKFNN